MPRAKSAAVIEDAEETEEEVKPRRRGRTPKTVAKEEAPAPRRRGRAAKAEVEDEPEEKPAKKGRPKADLLYVEQYKPVWDKLPEGEDSVVVLSDDVPARGAVQLMIADFMESRGRKKTTAAMVMDHLEAEGKGNVNGVVSHAINKGVLAVA